MSGYGGVATQDWRKGGGARRDYSLQGLDQDWNNIQSWLNPQLWLMLTLLVRRMSGYGGVATQDWRKGGGGRQDYTLQGLDQDWINVTLPHLR